MAKNDEYLCRHFFVHFNFWSKLSFQIPEFRVHWSALVFLTCYDVWRDDLIQGDDDKKEIIVSRKSCCLKLALFV